MNKETVAAGEEMRKIREDIKQKEERFLPLSDKVDKHEMSVAEMEAALRDLQAGSNASQVVHCCLDTVEEQLCAMGLDKAQYQFDLFAREDP